MVRIPPFQGGVVRGKFTSRECYPNISISQGCNSRAQKAPDFPTTWFGWDGDGGYTLEELGQKHGLSRERIPAGLHPRREAEPPGQGLLAGARSGLGLHRRRIPAPTERLWQQFDAAGFSRCGLPLESVQEAARLLGRPPGFEIVAVGDCRLAVRPGSAQFPRAIIQAAKRAVLSFGATTIGEVAIEVAKQCREAGSTSC